VLQPHILIDDATMGGKVEMRMVDNAGMKSAKQDNLTSRGEWWTRGVEDDTFVRKAIVGCPAPGPSTPHVNVDNDRIAGAWLLQDGKTFSDVESKQYV